MKKPTANMLLYTTFWQEYETFKLMPVTEDCPFIEIIYERHTGMLIVLNKHFKENFHMIPKLNDNGDAEPVKGARPNGKAHKEKRDKLQTYQDYFMINEEEQKAFIKMMAVNAESFDYDQFMKPPASPGSSDIIVPETPGIVDKSGAPIKSEKQTKKKPAKT